MLEIKMDKLELDYLLNSGMDKNLIAYIGSNQDQNFGNICLRIEKAKAEDILDFLGDEFSNNGLKKNDEPNSFRLMIENLIDKFSRGIYK